MDVGLSCEAASCAVAEELLNMVWILEVH
jgi:hypothetical protein